MTIQSVNERIKILFNLTEISRRRFAAKMGISSTYLAMIMKDQAPSYKVLDALLEAFPDLEKQWLYFGVGEMFKKDRASVNLTFFKQDNRVINEPGNKVDNSESYWKDEAYRNLEQEKRKLEQDNERLWNLVELIVGKGAAAAMSKLLGNRKDRYADSSSELKVA